MTPTHTRRWSHRPRTIAAATAMVLVGCAGQPQPSSSVAPSPDVAAIGTAAGSERDAPAPGELTTAPSITSETGTRSPRPSETSTAAPTESRAPAAGPFCDELETFMNAWLADEIPIPDLTGEFRRLGSIAPGQLPDDFDTLARGNDEVLATGELTDQQAYDASGAAVATYAMQDCGIRLED